MQMITDNAEDALWTMNRQIRFPEKVEFLSTTDIYYDPNQPRLNFDLESIILLGNSIKSCGLLKPISVERITYDRLLNEPDLARLLQSVDTDISEEYEKIIGIKRDVFDGKDKYLIITGDRRNQAHWRIGIKSAKCQVFNLLSKRERLALQIAEDSQERIPEFEVASDIVTVYQSMNELVRTNGNKEAVVPYTDLVYVLGRKEKDIKRAINFNDLDATIREEVTKGNFPYKQACEIGNIKNKRRQLKLFSWFNGQDCSVKEVATKVREAQYLENPFLDNSFLETIRKEVQSTQTQTGSDYIKKRKRRYDLSRYLTRKYKPIALQEIRSIIGIDPSPHESNILNKETIVKLVDETQGMHREEKVLYFARNRSRFSRSINHDVNTQTYETDLFGDILSPDKYKDPRIGELNEIIRTLSAKLKAFTELAKIDDKMIDMLRTRNISHDLETNLELVSDCSTTNDCNERKYNKARAKLYGKREFNPRYKPDLDIIHLDLDDLCEDENNVRRSFDEERLHLFANNIRLNGIIEPLFVEELEDRYRIIAGHRRYRACKILREEGTEIDMRCINVSGLSELDRKILQIVEDSQKPFTVAERARSWFRHYKLLNVERHENFEKLMELSEFSKYVGHAESTIRQAFSFLSLPNEIKDLVDIGILRYSIALQLSSIPSKYTMQNKRYRFNPEKDFYLTPEQIFYEGDNIFREFQYNLALKTAYFGANDEYIRNLIDENNPNNRQISLFSGEKIERLTYTNERRLIVNDLINHMNYFPRSLNYILRDDDSKLILNNRTLKKNWRELKKHYGQLKMLYV